MRALSRFLLPGALALAGRSLAAQQLDPALHGTWTLDVAKSVFGGGETPTAGRISWTEHGWVFALVFPNGYLYADAAVIDHGCTLLGVPSDYSCTVTVITPTHLRFTLTQEGALRRIGDIELLDSNTTRTVHRVTPARRPPYAETTLWHREPE